MHTKKKRKVALRGRKYRLQEFTDSGGPFECILKYHSSQFSCTG